MVIFVILTRKYMKPIFLIGYMGSGKSTLGNALAPLTGLRFIDLDDYIEEREGMKISEISAKRGEEAFRDMERQTLAEVAAMEDVIIGCGGGTPCRPGAMELMNARGTTVYLDASFPRLLARLKEGRAKRPLIAQLDDEELARFITLSLESRMPYYSLASGSFPSDRLEDEEQIAGSCAAFIARFIAKRP